MIKFLSKVDDIAHAVGKSAIKLHVRGLVPNLKFSLLHPQARECILSRRERERVYMRAPRFEQGILASLWPRPESKDIHWPQFIRRTAFNQS